MSHIHLPDGFLPIWLWVLGYALTALLAGILWRGERTVTEPRKFALMGALAAIMILIMAIEVPPFEYHLNLSVVTGIILGPRLAVLTALVVNLILALIGHGGITVVGLNTLVLSTEMIMGYYLFHLFMRMRLSIWKSTFFATFASLMCGTAAGYGIIAAGSGWVDRVLRTAAIRPGVEVGPGITGMHLDLARMAIIMFGIGAAGWIIEGVISAAIIAYLNRMIPELIRAEE